MVFSGFLTFQTLTLNFTGVRYSLGSPNTLFVLKSLLDLKTNMGHTQ